MLGVGSLAGKQPITGAVHHGGQVQPIGWPFAGTVLLEPGRAALEETKRTNGVPSGGVGERDADLGEALPEVAFFVRSGFPTGLKYLMRGEGPTYGLDLSAVVNCARDRLLTGQ